MSEIAIIVSCLCLVAATGLLFSYISIRGVALGIAGVLFSGLLVGHFLPRYSIRLDLHTMEFVREFGLILFVYSVGMQVGPSFFPAFKKTGFLLNALAAGIVVLGVLVTAGLYLSTGDDLGALLGAFSGAVTNTPALAAAQRVLEDLGRSSDATPLAYAVAYPFGIVGILITIVLIRVFCKISIAAEAERYVEGQLHGKTIPDVPSEARVSLEERKILVTNPAVLGKKIRAISEKSLEIVSLLRDRASMNEPEGEKLRFGDVLTVAGSKEILEKTSKILGNKESELHRIRLIPLFVGIGLGVLLGSVPLPVPGLKMPLKLGLAGGPLVASILLSARGHVGPLVWHLPGAAVHTLKDLGIVLFLSVVGLVSGGKFVDVLINGSGVTWVMYGVLITLIPLLIVGFFARLVLKLNYLTVSGVLAGSMTDPPALAFANALHPTSPASSVAYGTVYPLTMCLRILMPQVMALMLLG